MYKEINPSVELLLSLIHIKGVIRESENISKIKTELVQKILNYMI